MVRCRALLLPTLLLSGTLACTVRSDADGPHRISLRAAYPGGVPAVNAVVRVRSGLFAADTAGGPMSIGATPGDARTDDSGMAEIAGLDTGDYSVEVFDARGRASLVRCRLDSGSRDLGVAVLTPTGRVSGVLHKGMLSGRTWMQVLGLERVAEVDSVTGRYAFAELPAGTHTLRAVSRILKTYPPVIPGVTCASGDTAVVSPYHYWKYEALVRVNTAAAGVRETVTGFPVLLRLDQSNFNFMHARQDACDVRFADASGMPTAFEIEEWDAVNRRASVWVRMDTVRGGDSTQFFRMFYGNFLVGLTLSSGPAVFDTAAGFLGEYHLKPKGGSVADATARGNHATDSSTSVIRGVAGPAVDLGGRGSVGLPPALLAPVRDQLTISLWQRGGAAARPGADYVLDAVDKNMVRGLSVRLPGTGGRAEWCAGVAGIAENDCISAEAGPASGRAEGWNHWAFVKNAGTGAMKIYRDGALGLEGAGKRAPMNLPLSVVWLGSDHSGALLYEGAVDEFTVAGVERSAAWIRLCYENQRPDGALVRVLR